MKKIKLHTINLLGEDSYESICNSRIGGKPDLPIDVNYPINEDGFLEFLLQINLETDPIPNLPNQGMLSLFNGNLDKREAYGYYFNNLDKFETKEIPIKESFSGIVDYYETESFKFSIKIKEVISMQEQIDDDELNDRRFENYYDNSYVNGPGLLNSSELYFKTNNLELITYAVILSKQKKDIFYSGRKNKTYKTAQDVLECEIDNFPNNIHYPKVSTRAEFNEQLKRFETNKEYHLNRYLDFECLLSLASSNKTKMIWGDLHKLEMFGFRKEFNTNNFSKLYAWLK